MNLEVRRYLGTIVEMKLPVVPSLALTRGTLSATSPIAAVALCSGGIAVSDDLGAVGPELADNQCHLSFGSCRYQPLGMDAEQLGVRVGNQLRRIVFKVGVLGEVARWHCRGFLLAESID